MYGCVYEWSVYVRNKRRPDNKWDDNSELIAYIGSSWMIKSSWEYTIKYGMMV